MIHRLAPSLRIGLIAIVAALAFGNNLAAQTPPNARDLRIYAGLHAAAANGDIAEIERLIAAGERPNLQDSNSRTPLHVAAYRKHHAAAKALLRLGANPNARDADRYDIVTIAAAANDIEMLTLALESGADARAVTGPDDGTALIAAARRGHVEAVRILLARNAPLDHVNQRGWTALIETVALGNGGPNHVATVELLVKAGADTEVRDRRGATALTYARQRGYHEMIKILAAAHGRKT
jgi:ankyrin repeat protein